MVASQDRLDKTFSLLLIVLLALLAPPAVPAADDGLSSWVSLTSFKEVRRMRIIDDTLFMATSGGLLAVSDPDLPGVGYTNLDGLGTVDITDVIVDAGGYRWVAGHGRLVRFNPPDSRQYLFLDNESNLLRLLCVVDDGDQLWIGTEIGLVRFSKLNDGGQIEDSYTLFGDLNASPAVNDIKLRGDSIWLATSAGLAIADRSIPNLLKSPSNWTVLGPVDYPQLSTGVVRRVVFFESDIYLGTNRGLFRMDILPTDTVLTQMPVGATTYFSDIQVQNDSLFLFYGWGFAVIKDGAVSSVPYPGVPTEPVTGQVFDGRRWLAADSGGVFVDNGGTYAEYPYTGAPGNNVTDITIDRSGVLTAGFGHYGVARYIDGQWYESPVFVGNRSTFAASDSTGTAWVGTYGQGLWQVTDSGAFRWDESNSALIGNSDGVDGIKYVVIHGVDTDDRFVYAACYRALNNSPLVFGELSRLDQPDGWGALGMDEGITNIFAYGLDYDDGYVAMGTTSAGIFKCQVGSDPFNCGDGCCVHYTAAEWNLISDEIRVVKFAPDGLLWAGTNMGLSFFDPLASQQGRFVDVTLPQGFGPDVLALDFDRRGDAWVGSNNGLALLTAATGEMTYFTSINSGLVSDDIRSLTYDPFTGDMYAATASGISIYKSTTGPPTSVMDSVYAFPNPFVIASQGDRLSFNYALPGTISIFSIEGGLVYEMAAGQSWDGRNLGGSMVSSGVYLFVISGDNGDMGRGKFLLVRGR